MLTIQPLQPQHIPAARRLSDAAGWNQLDVDWQRLITLWPMTTLGGWLQDQLIATVSLTYFAPLPGGSSTLAWVGVMLVDAAHRGAGHGGAMFDAALRCGADRGIVDYGLDATDLGRPLYLKRGFADRFAMNRWACATPEVDGAAPSHLRPLAQADWDQVLALDRQAVQVQRGPLLQHLAHEPDAHCLIAHEAGKITGFGLRRAGRLAAYIGPLLAQDASTAATLCDGLIAAHPDPALPLFIDVGADCPIEPHLRATGFSVARKLIRMGRASSLCPLAYSPQVFAISGLELC